jgi:hypothetical protein
VDSHRRYMCRQCGLQPERYRAKDDIPVYAHLCVGCTSLLSEEALTHYVDLEGGDPPGPFGPPGPEAA